MIIKMDDGSLKGVVYSMGMSEGIGTFARNPKMDKVIPASVRAKVDKLEEAIKSGKLKIPEYGKPGESDKHDPRKVVGEMM